MPPPSSADTTGVLVLTGTIPCLKFANLFLGRPSDTTGRRTSLLRGRDLRTVIPPHCHWVGFPPRLSHITSLIIFSTLVSFPFGFLPPHGSRGGDRRRPPSTPQKVGFPPACPTSVRPPSWWVLFGGGNRFLGPVPSVPRSLCKELKREGTFNKRVVGLTCLLCPVPPTPPYVSGHPVAGPVSRPLLPPPTENPWTPPGNSGDDPS